MAEGTAAWSGAMGAGAGAGTPKKSSMLATIAEVGILTCFAIGAGGLFGMQVLSLGDPAAKRPEAVAPAAQKAKFSPGAALKPLPPIMTNLAGPKAPWIRIEASVVFMADVSGSNALLGEIAEDVIAYLRTVPLSDLEGPSGFLHLREDLSDRVRIRSGGKVREVVIQTLVLE